eukprot:TRINITY_DN4484_c0_g1_i1.p1 TRINITY_DN4484_c0_g1~~TRINITY_DN4484_c0_g1_i1.p1  ORF type:complete len:146 (-),score=30.85 TRINITY_DN4484_c0_g1_i1:201-638(-)
MAFLDSSAVIYVTAVYALAVFGGGLYGYLTAGSVISVIASTICAVIAFVLTYFMGDISPWPAVVWCLLLTAMFGKKAFGKEKQTMCPMHGDGPAMTEEARADPMSKYTRMEEGGKASSGSMGKVIMVVLTVFSIVEIVLQVQSVI